MLTIAAGATAGLTYLSEADPYAGPIGRYIQSLEPERAHDLAIKLARYKLVSPRLPFRPPATDPPQLSTQVWGMKFSNPIGLAAGFDKHAEAMSGLFSIGFGFIEVGSVTPLPQPGNEKPRVFRLVEDRGIINRYGFNSVGAEEVHRRLYHYDNGGRNQHHMGILGVNLGKNKHTSEENAVNDYLVGLQKLGDVAEYIVINVSSPNTPGLRALQGKERLRRLLSPILQARDELVYRPPIIVKIAPDLTDEEIEDICDVALEVRIDGIIVSNTTLDRTGLKSEHAEEKGGLSGRPLREKSTDVLRKVYRMTDGKIPLVGVGGVECAEDAYEKIRAGASLVQLYTALTYQGPRVIPRIKKGLTELLKKDGYLSVAEAVGADHRMSETGRVAVAAPVG